MEQFRLMDLCYAYEQLSKIKRPSKRVKAAASKLEEHICRTVESMRAIHFTPETPAYMAQLPEHRGKDERS